MQVTQGAMAGYMIYPSNALVYKGKVADLYHINPSDRYSARSLQYLFNLLI
jgi:hypothetical protein